MSGEQLAASSTSLCTCYACILASHLCLQPQRASTELLSFSVASVLYSFLWGVYLTSSRVPQMLSLPNGESSSLSVAQALKSSKQAQAQRCLSRYS